MHAKRTNICLFYAEIVSFNTFEIIGGASKGFWGKCSPSPSPCPLQVPLDQGFFVLFFVLFCCLFFSFLLFWHMNEIPEFYSLAHIPCITPQYQFFLFLYIMCTIIPAWILVTPAGLQGGDTYKHSWFYIYLTGFFWNFLKHSS